jgi:hypothetical protein
MNGWDAVFFPPSLAFADSKAMQLKFVLRRRRRLPLVDARDLIARIYGFADWCELRDDFLIDPTSTTVWDAELDSGTLQERKAIQINAITAGLRVPDLYARFILDDLNLSAQQPPSPSDNVQDFVNKFDEWLADMRNISGGVAKGSTALNRLPRASQASPKVRLRASKAGMLGGPGRTRF